VKHFRSHGSFRDSQNPGDFGVRVTFDIEQDDCGPAALRQLAERGSQTRTQLATNRHRVRSRTSAHQRRVEGLGLPDVAAPPPVRGSVGNDAHQPGAERAACIVLRELYQGGEKPVLRGVISIVRITQHRPGDPPRLCCVALHEYPECVALAR